MILGGHIFDRVTYLVDDAQPYEWIKLCQRTLLLKLELRDYLVCDRTDGGAGDAKGIQVFDFPTDVGVTHLQSEQMLNLV